MKNEKLARPQVKEKNKIFSSPNPPHPNSDKVPALRFPGFEGEWEEKKMGDITNKINSGKTPLGGEKVYQSDGILFIRSQNVNDNRLDLSNSTFISEDVNATMQNSIVKADDILLNITGASLGRSCVVPSSFITGNVNQHVCIIRLNSGFNPRFLQPILASDKGQKLFESLQTGSGREGLNFDSLKKIALLFPSSNEQQKIASFLSSVDERLQQLQQQQSLLERYKKSCMQQLFSQKLRFKDDKGKAYPDWEEKRLGEIAIKKTEKNKDLKQRFVLTNSATHGIISQTDYFDKEIANQDNLTGYYIVEVDDFVYNPRISVNAPVGPIKRNKYRDGVMSPLYSVFRFHQGVIVYLEYFFESTFWHTHMENIANYGARHDRMNITTKDFYEMVIPFPSIPEQTKIANFLSAIDEQINAVKQQVAQTQQFKKGLLQQLFV